MLVTRSLTLEGLGQARIRNASPDAFFLNPQLVVCETIVLNGYEWLLMMIDGY